MKIVALTKSQSTIIDDDDYEIILKNKWHVTSAGYAARREWKNDNRMILMHRQLTNAPKGMVVDHINGNKLDNRKTNLRVCSQRDNILNSGMRKNNTSGRTGVHWFKRVNKWVAGLMVDGKYIHLGYFVEFDEAVKARKLAEELYSHKELK